MSMHGDEKSLLLPYFKASALQQLNLYSTLMFKLCYDEITPAAGIAFSLKSYKDSSGALLLSGCTSFVLYVVLSAEW